MPTKGGQHSVIASSWWRDGSWIDLLWNQTRRPVTETKASNAVKDRNRIIVPHQTLTAANDLAEIRRVIAALETFGEDHALPPRVVTHMSLALDELMTNIITYGFDTPGPHSITLTLDLDDDALTVELNDGGRPFNPLQMPPPDLDLEIEDRPIGGLGIHLVRKMMDDVRYARTDGRNVLTLRKTVDPKADTE